MGKITALKIKGGRNRRVNVFLDGKFALSLEAEVAAREGLQVEQELSEAEIATLARTDRFQRCFNAAIRYLGYRPRSEAELRDRLRQRGFDDENIEAVTSRLKEQGLVNDTAFAQFWRDNRQSFSPRSRWLTQLELRRKGIASDIIDQTVEAIDDDDGAYQAALRKIQSLSRSDYQSFRRRLGEYLRRRGFSYEVINRTVERLWRDQDEQP